MAIKPKDAAEELRATLLDIAAEQRDEDKRGLSFSASMVADACEKAAYALSGAPAAQHATDQSAQKVHVYMPDGWMCVPPVPPDSMAVALTGYTLASQSNRRDTEVIRERAAQRWSDLLNAAGAIPVSRANELKVPFPNAPVLGGYGQ